MIRESDENAGHNPQTPGPRSLLRSIERAMASKSNDLGGASAALAAARKQNPPMQVYVKGHRALPRELPEAYAPGSKDEALCFAEGLREAWLKHPAALKWLEGQKVK